MTAQNVPIKSRPRTKAKAPRPIGHPIKAKSVVPVYAVDRPKIAPRRPQKGDAVGSDLFHIASKLSPLQTHDLVTVGLPVVSARELMASFRFIERSAVLKAVGISERTLQRGKTGEKLLDSNASDRVLRLASVTELATDVLGSRESAERWLSVPAIGLDQRIPIELLQSTEGTELVKTLLTRMDYGVYA